jgi:subtilase family serine protease
MTREEISELVNPPVAVQKAVLRWIHSVASTMPEDQVIDVDNQGEAIVVKATVAFVEKLFRTEMYLFHNERNNAIMAKHLGSLSIPVDLVDHIKLVTGITELPPIKNTDLWYQNRPKKVEQDNLATRQTPDNECNVPYTIKNLYNVPNNLYVTNANSNASIYAEPSAGSPEGFGLGSIEDYQHALGIPKNPITCIVGNGVQYYIQNDTDLEANLDTEMLTGMAPNTKTCFYIMETGQGWMYEFTRQIFKTVGAPLVVSMSYGWNEVDSCDNLTAGYDFIGNCTYYHIPNSEQYVNLTNINFQKLGALGHTLVAASGDGGTAGTHGTLDNCATQGPIFPAASPYVLTVGATSVEETAGPSLWKEKAGAPAICTDSFYECDCSTSNNEQPALANNTAGFDTGGGFSVFSAQPSYQAAAVQAYLKSGVVLPPAKYFNGNNRGFPDVAGVGEQVCLLDPGSSCNFVGGTSASTPLWGALMVLLNQDRLNAGKAPLGFFNQVVYQMFAADSEKYFNNKFESGNNPGGCPSDMGFNAKSGFWTPLTGCGSPNFATIREYVATLP